MLTAFDIITTIIDDVLGILFISKFYPFRDKINIRIPICVGILAVHSFLNVYLIYHMYFMKSLSFIAAFVLCTVIMLKCDKGTSKNPLKIRSKCSAGIEIATFATTLSKHR